MKAIIYLSLKSICICVSFCMVISPKKFLLIFSTCNQHTTFFLCKSFSLLIMISLVNYSDSDIMITKIFSVNIDHIVLQSSYVQVHNLVCFRAGQFSWNQGILINSHVQNEKEKPCREKYPFFSPGNSQKIHFKW